MTDLEKIFSGGGDKAIREMADNDFGGQAVTPGEYREMGATDEQYIDDLKSTLPCWRKLSAEQYATWHARIVELVESN